MKIISDKKEGVTMLIERNEAVLVFTPEGIQTSMPREMTEGYWSQGKPSKDSMRKTIEWMDENNKFMSVFMEVLTDLQKSGKLEDMIEEEQVSDWETKGGKNAKAS